MPSKPIKPEPFKSVCVYCNKPISESYSKVLVPGVDYHYTKKKGCPPVFAHVACYNTCSKPNGGENEHE